MTLLPFSLQVSVGCPQPCSLALALAAELRPVDEPTAEAALDELRDQLAPHAADRSADQLQAVAQLAGTFERSKLSATVDDLLVDSVLRRRRGHPAAIGVVLCEAAQRAGLPVHLVGDGLDLLPAHRATPGPLVVDVAKARVRTADDRSLPWRCGHQTAFTLLRELLDAAVRTGDLASALTASELRLALPLDERLSAAARDETLTLRARLN